MKKVIHRKVEIIDSQDQLQELLNAIITLKNTEDLLAFLKDLCTPQELTSLSDRWKVCKLLNEGKLSYREIHEATGVSLATIVRVARFLNTEPHRGYELALKKIKKLKKI
jgi:TrpR-related protein YerC/YecD